MMKSIRHLSSMCIMILREPSVEAAGTWAKMAIHSVLHPKPTPGKTRKIRAYGYDIEYYDRAALSILLRELFLQKEYYFNISSSDPLIIDGGSNIGVSVLYFKKKYPAASVIAFEPGTDTFEILKRNVERNSLKDVELHQKALYDRTGEIEFFVNDEPGNMRCSVLKERLDGRLVKIKCVQLSSFIDRPCYVKLDIEGAETAVIEDLARSGKLRYVEEIIIEYHHHITPQADGLSSILKALEDNGIGYHIGSSLPLPYNKGEYKDVMIYGYKKKA